MRDDLYFASQNEPFTVAGPPEFIRAALGWPATCNVEHELRVAVSSHETVSVAAIPKAPAIKAHVVRYSCNFGDHFEVTFMRAREVAKPVAKSDPWIKVGTTTIDGTLDQMLTVLEETDMERSAEDAIDAFMRDDGPWLIGGRYLKARGSHVNLSAGTALIRCDIVRRQSEIDEEEMIDAEVAYQAQRAAMPETRPTCPECSPHGNRGEVLLASSWAKCTTCAGGKAGDLWGGVEAQAEDLGFAEWDTGFDASKTLRWLHTAAQIYEAHRASVMACMNVPRDMLFGEQPGGFKVPTPAEIQMEIARRIASPPTTSVITNGQVVLRDGSIATVENGRIVRTNRDEL